MSISFDPEYHDHLLELRSRNILRLRELEKKQATLGYATPPEILLEIKDIQDRVAELDKELSQLNSSAMKIGLQQDLEVLLQSVSDDFRDIRGEQSFTSDAGAVAYKSKFSFEHSLSNTIWSRPNGTSYFSCRFYEGSKSQEAEGVFNEYAERLKLFLVKEWMFREEDDPEGLTRKELEAVRRYNTMRLRLQLDAYTSINDYQVDFRLEGLKI